MNTAVKLALGMVALTFVALLGLQTMASRAPRPAAAGAPSVSLPVAAAPAPAAPDGTVEPLDAAAGAGSDYAELTVADVQREPGLGDASLAEAVRETQATVEQSSRAAPDAARAGVSFEPGAPMVNPTPQ